MDATADPRRLRWDACYNVRDLGGFDTIDGRVTRWRAFVRSDNICRLTSHGRHALLKYGIRTVIDLRSPDELTLEIDPFSGGDMDEVAYVSTPLMTTEFLARSASGLDGLFEIAVLDMCGDAVAAVFATIATAPAGGVLVYCHAGKERTGIAAALLLAHAGVPAPVVAWEYALSDRYLEPLYEAWVADQPASEEPRRTAKDFVLRPDRMTTVLGYLDDRYGGTTEYLRWTGLGARELARTRERLVG